jgi:hypothetical protein
VNFDLVYGAAKEYARSIASGRLSKAVSVDYPSKVSNKD